MKAKEVQNMVSMDKLKECIGKKVTAEYSYRGEPFKRTGVLEDVKGFANVKINGIGISFIGKGTAIREIRDSGGNTLYRNGNVSLHYNIRDMKSINEAVLEAFGEAALKQRLKEIFSRDMEKALRDYQ